MSTTDPGMEDGLKRAADDVESDPDPNDDDLGADDENAEHNYLEPTRWWFASTACPLLAGTFGPIASAFNICALVYNWRVYIPDQGTEEHGEIIRDPAWLITINALSLVAALVANASLLLNMARRLRFSIAQPITISGFLVAGALLICDMAALTASPTYRIPDPKAIDPVHHALSSAFYYAIFAAMDYLLIGFLMCVTVYGANRGYYKKDFQLTPSQRTLMLQTMSFMTYLLLGALVFSKIEGWEFLDAVYWANVTLLTVGIGDFTPATDVGKGLLFPFAIGGILIVGLVVGSIRTLVLERGKEKLSARITEKHRASAVNHVDQQHDTIKVGLFAKADFPSDRRTPLAQRRREEFNVMRKVQSLAETQRRYMALAMSASIALTLWLGGAAIFMAAEKNQQWTYFNALYFSFTSLLTIGYGDYVLLSNSGKPFFVLWSLLAVPSLTILISNMGDTIVKWVTDLTDYVGRITVLPDEEGFRNTVKMMMRQLRDISFTPPGIFGDIPKGQQNKEGMHETDLEARMLDRLADRLSSHMEEEDLRESDRTANDEDALQRDIHFYHYVLSRECRNVQRDLSRNPPKQYAWGDWEYFLKLMGNEEEPERASFERSNTLVPDALLVPNNKTSSTSDLQHQPAQVPEKHKHRRHRKQHDTWTQGWSWLSPMSPLMSTKSESEWILERLSAALERELNLQRRGHKKTPPISYSELRKHANGGGEGLKAGNASKGQRRDQEEAVEHEFLDAK